MVVKRIRWQRVLVMEFRDIKGPFVTGTKIIWRHSRHTLPFLKSQRFRNKELRVSMAAICKIRVDGKFLLVRNRHRQGYFGPFGGVIKHFEGAMTFLDSIDFNPEKKAEKDADLKDDLRGFFPGKNLGNFLLWFEKGHDREQAIDTLRRELREEAREAGFSLSTEDNFSALNFRKIREVHEGPYVPHSVQYPQYRNIEVYEPIKDERLTDFIESLGAPSNSQSVHYCLASRDEIDRGKLDEGHGEFIDNMDILPNVSYLFSSQPQKNESAPI